MNDPGTREADAAQATLEKRMRAVYRWAQKEIIEKLDAHTKRMNAMDKVKRAQLAAGQITEKQYNDWLNGQVFRGKQWKDQVDSIAGTLLGANQQANAMIEGKKRAVFGENATYQAYKLEHDAGLDLSFNVYDSATVTRLLKDHPELLPRKVVNGKKDKAWNRHKIANAVTQGIIQGESIPQIAQRIAKQTSNENMTAMTRYARTAMTGAQNAGRMEMLHEAQDMGINVKKKWLATLDSRTRDTHADLDGQVVDVDEPFHSSLGPIMYPGDPSADPGNVYNCRCTMVYVYEDYPEQSAKRLDNISGESAGDMTYTEWKGYKEKQSGKFESAHKDYTKKVNPSAPRIEIDAGYISNDKQHERAIADELSSQYGGKVRMVNQAGNVATPDFIWNNAKWELKGARSLNAASKRTQDAIHQAETWGGNIIIDFMGDDIYGAISAVRSRLRRSARESHDVIIMHKGKVVQIFRYTKQGKV